MYFSNSLRDRKRRKLIISWIFFQPDGMAVGMGEQTSAGPRATPPPNQDGTLGCREDALLAFGATGEPVLPVPRAGVQHGLARPHCHRAVSQVWLCQGHVHNGAAPGESVPQEGSWNTAGWETSSFSVFPEPDKQARGEGDEEGGGSKETTLGCPGQRASMGDPQPQAQTEDSK